MDADLADHLPESSKYLLLSAFLASFNPAKLDRRLFSSQSSKVRHMLD
jgi:Origin recognition complex (ORC) subunit 5 C-terminus